MSRLQSHRSTPAEQGQGPGPAAHAHPWRRRSPPPGPRSSSGSSWPTSTRRRQHGSTPAPRVGTSTLDGTVDRRPRRRPRRHRHIVDRVVDGHAPARTGNSGASSPTTSSSTPAVTSGGTSRMTGADRHRPPDADRPGPSAPSARRPPSSCRTPRAADAAERTLAGRARGRSTCACSRFRDDSELQVVHDDAGRTVAGQRRCSSRPSTWPALRPSAREVRSTRPSATRSPHSATTPTSTRSWRGPPAPPRALGPVAGYAHVQLDPARPHRAHPAWRPARPRLDGQGAGRRPGRRPHRPARSATARWSASVATSPSPGRPPPAVGPSASPASRRRRPAQVDQVVAITPRRPGQLRHLGAGAGRRATAQRPPHRRPADRRLRRALLGPGLGHRRQLRRGQHRHDRRHRVGRAGPRQARRLRTSRCASSASTERSSRVNGWPAGGRRHELDLALVRHAGQRPHGARPAHR